MATKIGISLLKKTLNENNYDIVDTVIHLVHMSTELKDLDNKSSLFVIPVEKNTINFLANKLSKNLKTSVRTLNTLVKKLVDKGYIHYCEDNRAWIIDGMEKDFSKNGNGYIYIRKLFFTKEFQDLKKIEKRLVLYMAQLKDSKAAKKYKGKMTINFLRKPWYDAMKITNYYYAIRIVKRLLKNHTNWFSNIDIGIGKISFNAEFLDEKINTDNNNVELINLLHPKEVQLLDEAITEKTQYYNQELVVTPTEKMHIIRAISNVSTRLQKICIQEICNKLVADRIYLAPNPIKSIPKYVAAITARIIKEYKEFRLHLNNLKSELAY